MKHSLLTINLDECESPDLALRKKSIEVTHFENDLFNLIDNMLEIMYSLPYATGLSAIQLGVPLRIFVFNPSHIKEKEIIAINPQVISISGPYKKRTEGCLSLPSYKGTIKRRNKITFSYESIMRERTVLSLVGYESAIIQHEFDHLNGILFWDYLNSPQDLCKIKEYE